MTSSPQYSSDAAEWDARYSESGHMWSGNPNNALVDVAGDLAPGTALDVGCGEGADALWLAEHGWTVTAIDPSQVAIDRAVLHDKDRNVTWKAAGITDLRGAGKFDLVSAMYPAVRKEAHPEAIDVLLELVAPGGHLLFVHHVVDEEALAERPHFAGMYLPEDAEQALAARPEEWELVTAEDRQRHIEGGRGAHHTVDRVVIGRRLV
ncbi:class I SAM-dependent methyltransferase [Corynebacterium sp.]|uniref:class I SAM-dependent methyltransferase n=1 Tax=Corynebacterium sp. TaxID=1720 RepID=UPI0037354D85